MFDNSNVTVSQNITDDDMIVMHNLSFEKILRLKSIFITEVLDKEMYQFSAPNKTNFSTGGLLKADFPINLRGQSEVIQYFHIQFLNQLDLLYNDTYVQSNHKLPFKICNNVKVRLNYNLLDSFTKILNEEEQTKINDNPIDHNNSINHLLAEITEYRNTKIINDPYTNMIEAVLCSFFSDMSYFLNSQYKNYVFPKHTKKPIGNKGSLFEFVCYCLENYQATFDENDNFEYANNDYDDIGIRFIQFLNYMSFQILEIKENNKELWVEISAIIARYQTFLNYIGEKRGIKSYRWENDNDHYFPISFHVADQSGYFDFNIKEFYEEYKK